jgi:hypothetical protein
LKCLRHLNDKGAAQKIFSLVIFITGLSVGMIDKIALNSLLLNLLSNYLAIRPSDLKVDLYHRANGNEASTASGNGTHTGDSLLGSNDDSLDDRETPNFLMKVLNRVFLKDLDDELVRKVEEATKQREDLENKVFARKPERLSQSLIDSGPSEDNTSISLHDFKTNSGKQGKKSKKKKDKGSKETFGL